MSTEVISPITDQAARKELPPVEADRVSDAPAAGIAPLGAPEETLLAQQGGQAHKIAHWIHEHPNAYKSGTGLLVYQIARSAAAAIPYGISMALTLGGLTKAERIGAALEKSATSTMAKGFGRGLKNTAAFGPLRVSAQVATSFTLYRGTTKIGKWITEYLFNPKDSEARTVEKLHDLPGEVGRKVEEVAPAEVSSTPVAAIALGFITSAFDKSKVPAALAYTKDNFKAVEGFRNKFKLLGSVIAHPNAKFLSQAAINTIGYSVFFEMGDRLFKDKQIERGVWPGEPNSIKALKAAPDEYAQGLQDNANGGIVARKYADSPLEPKESKTHYGFFTHEPGLGRFAFRRVLPTAIGIGAYTAVKFRWSSMLFNDFRIKEGNILKQLPKLALTEGAATSLFFLIPLVSENWEKLYDTFWEKREKAAHAQDMAKAPTVHQQQKYGELLERVNAKEQGQARVA